MRLSSISTSSGILIVMLVMGRSLRRRARRSLPFISSSFVDSNRARRDEADASRAENIDNPQQFPVSRHTNSSLTLLASHNVQPDESYKGVKKDLACSLEGDAVLAEVQLRLFLIPPEINTAQPVCNIHDQI